ncbi:MAG: RsiV family protein [Acutalibacteraceae bacterium]
MNDFDKYIKSMASEENTDIPDSVKNKIEETLAALPEKNIHIKKTKILPRIAATAACFIFVIFFLLPNVSVAYAEAFEEIPIIGRLIKVITVRNYFYSDDYHEMDIDVPKVSGEDGDAADYINNDVNKLTDTLVKQFYKDLDSIGDSGHSSIYVDYETVTNTESWFTLKMRVHEAAGSSNTYYKYYHIDKKSGKIIKLSDLSEDEGFLETLEKEIRQQMRSQMDNDSSKIYWLDDSVIGKDYVAVTPEHNFFWNENGDLVIVFDKYEVAPGAMGTPEFTVDKALISDMLKSEYKNMPF